MNWNERYSRQLALPEIGSEGQQKLSNAKVLVIGAGGLGCPVLQNLAAAGVGRLGIVDGDRVAATNLHRQLLYTTKDCGKSKVKCAKKALLKSNPLIEIITYNQFFTAATAITIVADYDIIVDCTDTIPVRYLINDVAVSKGIPVVYGSIHKFEGQVAAFNYKNGPSYRCLFPEEEKANSIPNCVTTGVLGVIPNLIGTFQANEVLKIILGIGEVLTGKLLVVNGLNLQTQLLQFSKSVSQIEIGKKAGGQLLNSSNELVNRTIEATAFFSYLDNPEWLVIDIREPFEVPKLLANSILNIPISEIEKGIPNLSKQQNIILFCQSGQRSLTALTQLQKEGFENVYHLENGVNALPLIPKN